MNRKEEIVAFGKANGVPDEHIPFFVDWMTEYDKGNEPDEFISMEKLNEINLGLGLDVMMRYLKSWSTGHSKEWTKTFAESTEDEDVAIREAYEEMRKLTNCGYEPTKDNPVYIEAYNSSIKDGKGETYAKAYATRITDDVDSIENVRQYAEAVEEQINSNRTQLFSERYANHFVAYGGNDNSKYYADYYEKAILAGKEVDYAAYFSDNLTTELVNLIHLHFGEEPTFDHLFKFTEWKFKADAREYCIKNQIKNSAAFIRQYNQECINEVFPGDDGHEPGGEVDDEYMKDVLLSQNIRLEDPIREHIVVRLLKNIK